MIKIENLSFSYNKKSPQLLNNLSFEINDGNTLVILGKNGVGKTTLLKCLSGEIRNYSGNILIDSENLLEYTTQELSHKIALVASNSTCYQNLCVADYLVTGLSNQFNPLQSPNKLHYEKAFQIIKELKQEKLFDSYIYELSSGEMQIVKIGRAILQNPRIIIFDEPTSNLDIKNQLLVLNQIADLSKRGYTVVTTTHNPGQAIELDGYTLMLHDEGYHFGLAKDIIDERNLNEIYDLNVFTENISNRKITIFNDEKDVHKLVY